MIQPQQIVTQLFTATDEHDWAAIEQIFAEDVLLDYSSMSGQPAARLHPAQITAAWKTVLPGFEHTQHQVSNFLSTVEGEKAQVSCYGTANHYLSDDSGSLWTVYGTYDFVLSRTPDNSWKITAMKFNFKFQDGNISLPVKATKRAKR